RGTPRQERGTSCSRWREEKLQALRKRLGGATSRLGSEVRDGGVARETEDAVNELQRQMGELETKCGGTPEDSGDDLQTADRHGGECRSTEAVSVLHRQFEKFVWPTVPQQEERISQITELAVRLHGVEEGRRYTEKTVGKHSEMVESIRALSDGLLALEARLREASDMHELKETGHTPTDRRSCSLDAERQTESRATSSYCSTHTFNFRCSPLDTNRRVHNIHNQSQPAATEATPSPSVTGPSFSDIQREFGKDASRGSLSEAELHDVMMEDSLSNDEYDCASPDDMSLPPLAETPESIMIQSELRRATVSVPTASTLTSTAASQRAAALVLVLAWCSPTTDSPAGQTAVQLLQPAVTAALGSDQSPARLCRVH
ncbi:hypothetical protein KUCAC02_033201, partial [Chaenocephalus aceratus]